MTNHPDLPTFMLSCDSLEDLAFTRVIELDKYLWKVWAFREKLDTEGNIDVLIIFAPSQDVANNFARDLGQEAIPVPIKPPSSAEA